MAKITIDIKRGIAEAFQIKYNKDLRDITKKWSKASPSIVIKNMKKAITSGNSPVKGHGRFPNYSSSYSGQIKKGRYKEYGKKLRPINLTLTGQMLRSLISRRTSSGFTVYFTSPIAKYHNDLGAGRSKVIRRLLPLAGSTEQFKHIITKEIQASLRKMAKEAFGSIK